MIDHFKRSFLIRFVFSCTRQVFPSVHCYPLYAENMLDARTVDHNIEARFIDRLFFKTDGVLEAYCTHLLKCFSGRV